MKFTGKIRFVDIPPQSSEIVFVYIVPGKLFWLIAFLAYNTQLLRTLETTDNFNSQAGRVRMKIIPEKYPETKEVKSQKILNYTTLIQKFPTAQCAHFK